MWYSAVNFGDRNPRLEAVMKRQFETLPQVASQYLHPTKIALAKVIAQDAERKWDRPGRVHFNVGGSQAIEDSLKLVRNACGGKSLVFAFEGGYHGRTLGASSITSSNHYRRRAAAGVAASTTAASGQSGRRSGVRWVDKAQAGTWFRAAAPACGTWAALGLAQAVPACKLRGGFVEADQIRVFPGVAGQRGSGRPPQGIRSRSLSASQPTISSPRPAAASLRRNLPRCESITRSKASRSGRH